MNNDETTLATVQPPAASQPGDEDWTPEQIDELAGVVRDKCGPATAQRLRGIIERAQSPAASQPSNRQIANLAAMYGVCPPMVGYDKIIQLVRAVLKLSATQPPAASLAQAVKAGLAKRFPDDPPMEIAAIQPPAASQPSIDPHPDTVRIDWIDRNVGCSLGLHNGRDLDLSAEGIRDVIDRATLAAEQDYK